MGTITVNMASHTAMLIEAVKKKEDIINQWLNSYEQGNTLPLYSSVDIRDSGYKMAVVDTNIFPAGFNNLCEHGILDAIKFIRKAILQRIPHGKNVIIIAEEHTRNMWYLENVRVLKEIIEKAGFNIKISTFFSDNHPPCEELPWRLFTTATGYPIKLYCLKRLLDKKEYKIDLIILNNDLTSGIPDILKNVTIPIYPSAKAGWHSRMKSQHFEYTHKLISELAEILEIDPWLLTCLHSSEQNIDINNEIDRNRLMKTASKLLKQIEKKYYQYNISERPYILIKSDSGTYGMGVVAVEQPTEILKLNRRNRNKLYKGKNSKPIRNFLLQEGIPTIYNIEQQASEVCIYQIDNNLIGGFYRLHSMKGNRDNLNSQGMTFKKMCPHSQQYKNCGIRHDVNIFDIYRILARVAGIAAHLEIKDLEQKSNSMYPEK